MLPHQATHPYCEEVRRNQPTNNPGPIGDHRTHTFKICNKPATGGTMKRKSNAPELEEFPPCVLHDRVRQQPKGRRTQISKLDTAICGALDQLVPSFSHIIIFDRLVPSFSYITIYVANMPNKICPPFMYFYVPGNAGIFCVPYFQMKLTPLRRTNDKFPDVILMPPLTMLILINLTLIAKTPSILLIHRSYVATRIFKTLQRVPTNDPCPGWLVASSPRFQLSCKLYSARPGCTVRPHLVKIVSVLTLDTRTTDTAPHSAQHLDATLEIPYSNCRGDYQFRESLGPPRVSTLFKPGTRELALDGPGISGTKQSGSAFGVRRKSAACYADIHPDQPP